MNMASKASWNEIQDELRRRIVDGIWQPGDLIPTEEHLAEEFKCARATVNRALRSLAESGLLDRRRKAGSRVATEPSRYATLKIDIIRLEIERRGASYRHVITNWEVKDAPELIRYRMNLTSNNELLNVCCLHFADERPFIYEERWLNPAVIPDVLDTDFSQISANEWLVRNIMFTRGDISFSATSISQREAELFEAKAGEAAFVIDRTTWQDEQCITYVRLMHQPGFSMRMFLS